MLDQWSHEFGEPDFAAKWASHWRCKNILRCQALAGFPSCLPPHNNMLEVSDLWQVLARSCCCLRPQSKSMCFVVCWIVVTFLGLSCDASSSSPHHADAGFPFHSVPPFSFPFLLSLHPSAFSLPVLFPFEILAATIFFLPPSPWIFIPSLDPHPSP